MLALFQDADWDKGAATVAAIAATRTNLHPKNL